MENGRWKGRGENPFSIFPSPGRRKIQVLAFLGAACVILILLAASLPHLELQAGRPFFLGGPEVAVGGGNGPGGGEIFLLIIRGMLTLALVLLPVYIIIHLLTPEGRRRLLADLVAFLLVVLLLNLLPKNPQPPPTETQPAASPLSSLLPAASEPTDQFVAQPAPWLDLLVIGVLAVLVAGAVAGALWWIRRRATSGASSRLDRLAQQAQDTLDAVRAGGNIRDAVIRSYVQMSQVLQQERDIRRESAMTPHEFEQRLMAEGLPPEPVRQLTRLFESVRYGHQPAGEREEALAIASLEAIVAHCRRAGDQA